MKRALVIGSAMLLCLGLVGCGDESNEGRITETINMMGSAASEIGNIRSRVKDAADKARNDPTAKLDLTAAIDATKNLKNLSEEAMKIKRNIEKSRAKITEKEKETYYSDEQKGLINSKFKELLDAQVALQRQLADAESISANAKVEVDKLREKIQIAQSPFESIAR